MQWVHRERRTRSGDRGVFVDDAGLMLVLVAHHHRRGVRVPLTEELWQAAVTLTALAGPWPGARLLLEAATDVGPSGPQQARHHDR